MPTSGINVTTTAEPLTAEAANKVVRKTERYGLSWQVTTIVCILVLCVFGCLTILFGRTMVIKSERDANEDARWQDALKTISVSVDTNNIVSTTLLRSFLASPRYKAEAIQMGRSLLPRVNNYDNFADLFNLVFVGPTEQDTDALVEINRRVTRRYFADADLVDKAKKKEMSKPTPAASASNKMVADAAIKLNEEADQLALIMTFTGTKIADSLRTRQIKTGRKLDLRNAFFFGCDLSATDLSGSLLNGASFQKTNIAGLRLANIEGFETSNWYDVHWWEAREISAPLLLMLKDQFYPFYSPSQSYVINPTREDYISNLERLCKIASVKCVDVKFGPIPTGKK